MAKPILHFVHGNSFPADTYRVFFGALDRHYDVRALPMHAHNPAYPVEDGWPALVRELIDELTRRYTGPVILCGHSMGGVLALMAARARPGLVRCVLLLDAPLIAGWRALVLRTFKKLRIDTPFSPAHFSKKRRQHWPDAASAYRHYADKPLFSAWPQQVLRDYVQHGLTPHAEGVTLRFSRDIETAVYRSLPHHLGSLARRPFPVPVGFVGGRDSVECRLAGLSATRRLTGRHFRQIEGGHLFPLESPAIAADAAHEMIQSLLDDNRSA
jgi:pimeloyl-ACP methyl ester carboxylesterase